jgi:hypothetical protein
MTNDVHLEALRAAARVAFSVAFLGGCAAANANADDEALTSGGPEAAESDLKGGTPAKKKKPASVGATSPTASAPCHADAGTKPPVSCEQVLASAFPTPGMYPGEKKNVSSDVEACCEKELLSDEGMGTSKHRWDCCANVTSNDPKIMIACTPWGPPVPPAMRRRGGVDAWIVQGVA